MSETEIPIEYLYEQPIVQELLDKLDKLQNRDLEKEITIPYILKDKILMSPGVWNNYFYSAEAIKDAFLNTKWNKETVRSLFLDHQDLKSREWCGEVKNVRMEGDTIKGDLYVLDKPTAIKLAWGAKFGISPKVTGQEDGNQIRNFLFDNFSVVINPAVKTAYINQEAKKMEEEKILTEVELKKKEEPKEEEMKKEKYPEEEEKEKKMAKKEKYPTEPFAGPQGKEATYSDSEIETELSAWTDKIKAYIKKHPGAGVKEAVKAIKKMEENEELVLSDIIKAVTNAVTEELKKKYPYPYEEKKQQEEKKKKPEEEEEMQKKKEKYPEEEKKMEQDKIVQEMQEKIIQLEKKLNEPDKQTIKTEELSLSVNTLDAKDVDRDMLGFLQSMGGGY